MGVNEDNGKRDMKDGPTKKPFIYYYFLVILIVMILNALVFPMMEHTVEVPYSEFITQLDAGNGTLLPIRQAPCPGIIWPSVWKRPRMRGRWIIIPGRFPPRHPRFSAS